MISSDNAFLDDDVLNFDRRIHERLKIDDEIENVIQREYITKAFSKNGFIRLNERLLGKISLKDC